MNLFSVSIHSHCFGVNGYQIEWPRWSEVWNQYPDWGPHPHPNKWPKWPWRSRGIWKHPIMSTIPVSGKKTDTWLSWDSVLFGNTGDLHQRWEIDTTTILCMAGANCGRHCLRWQSWPNRSHSDWPRSACPVLWVALIRRTELQRGMRCHIHIVRHHQLGWQTRPAQCQTSKPWWWPVVNLPSYHWRTHQTKRAWLPSFHPTCFNTVQFP